MNTSNAVLRMGDSYVENRPEGMTLVTPSGTWLTKDVLLLTKEDVQTRNVAAIGGIAFLVILFLSCGLGLLLLLARKQETTGRFVYQFLSSEGSVHTTETYVNSADQLNICRSCVAAFDRLSK